MKPKFPKMSGAELVADVAPTVEDILAGVARDTIEFAQSYRGIVSQDGSNRPRHESHGGPPGWADKRGTMARSYGAEVRRGSSPGSVTIVLFNDAPHASFVEAKGYYVIRGLPEYFHELASKRLPRGR